jgi:hypothetical protein
VMAWLARSPATAMQPAGVAAGSRDRREQMSKELDRRLAAAVRARSDGSRLARAA